MFLIDIVCGTENHVLPRKLPFFMIKIDFLKIDIIVRALFRRYEALSFLRFTP